MDVIRIRAEWLQSIVIPSRVQDQTAKIDPSIAGIQYRQDIGLHIAERGERLMDDASSERSNRQLCS